MLRAYEEGYFLSIDAKSRRLLAVLYSVSAFKDYKYILQNLA